MRINSTTLSCVLPTTVKEKIAEIKKGSRGVGSGQDTAWAVKDVRLRVMCPTKGEGGEVTAPREAEKGICCSCVTEAFSVFLVRCPAFGTSVHMKNAQVAGEAEEEAQLRPRSSTRTQPV